MEAVENRALDLSSKLKNMLDDIPNVSVLSPRERQLSSGLTAFQIQGAEPDEVVAKLWSDHNIVSRQVKEISAIRISTHFFNTDEELSYLTDAVRKIAL